MDKLSLTYSSVEDLDSKSSAVFITDSTSALKDSDELEPVSLDNQNAYIPWGEDNQKPFALLDLIRKDETLSTCQMFNTEVCYGAGLEYNCVNASEQIKDEVDLFMMSNSMPSYFLGVSQDLKFFGFAVSVIILSKDRKKIVGIARKEACYCRFEAAPHNRPISKIYYADWSKSSLDVKKDVETIFLLNPASPWSDLQSKIQDPKFSKIFKFAILSKIPDASNSYYPTPYYQSIFKGKWYNIKQLIGIAKEATLKNSAPIKYQIEISDKYWESLFRSRGITDPQEKQKAVVAEKENIKNFLTGAENSGKVWFSMFYTNPTGEVQHDVVINKIEDTKQGGDWSTDIQEAINMLCFAMRVHSNLVGSVPGKAQTNNSGSDKRELYTIAQALQKPYHDLLFLVHKIIIRFNEWKGVYPDCPFVMLSTLDENKDAKLVTTKNSDK